MYRRRPRYVRNKKFIRKYLKGKKCIRCGICDPRVLQFDHYKGVKVRSISKLVQSGYSIENIENELKKCRILCANCHQIRTQRQMSYRYVKRRNSNKT